MKLTVIVTVYNEVKTVLQAIEDIKKIKVPEKEIIIIDNCSSDGTRELLKQLDQEEYKIIFNEKNINSGSFVKGMKMARGEYLYVHHTDLEYDPADANKMLALAEKDGYDVVLGSRLKDKNESIWGIIRECPEYLATVLCTALVNRWWGKNFTDMIGSRIYRTASIREIPVTTIGYGFEFENISRVCKRGLKVTEVPVSYRPRSWKEGKKIRPYHIINALLAMVRVRLFG